jgi:hypothetical protein
MQLAATVCAFASVSPWLDITADPGDRARALCTNLTIDEKISLLHGTGRYASVVSWLAQPLCVLIGWGAAKYVGVAAGVKSKGIPDLNLNDGPQVLAMNFIVLHINAPIVYAGLSVQRTWEVSRRDLYAVS